ncbi:MAG TPA: ribosome maturation factor RimM [Thermoanaerobaculia bacterium]|nr:ribosome maturation factor RimM [Thermoanaerobaculia bacterium]HQR68355.1 ribosome maturation factor RimM [Thermoanaerobaculia bacterium]
MRKPSSGSRRGLAPPRRSAGSSRRTPEAAGPLRPEDLVAVGQIVRPHGVRGEAAVELLTDFPDRIRAGGEFAARSPGGALETVRVASVRPHGTRRLVRFEGIATPEAVERLRGFDLCALPGDEPERPEGFVFHHEAAGLLAVGRDGRPLGTVKDLVEAGGRPLLLLETPRGEREVPFSRPIVVAVDLAGRRLVLDPPAGLLD